MKAFVSSNRGLGWGAHRWPRSFTRLASVFILALILGLAGPSPASATDAGLDLSTSRTDAQIRLRWNQLRPTHVGTPYLVTPSTTAPFATGSLKPSFLADGINMLNFARFVAGLPDDVTLDAGYNLRAQHGAVLVATSSTLTHYPLKPADMAQEFYDEGRASTTSSNLGRGHASLASFERSCLGDADSTNIDRVGHRRWLLNPQMAKTGMGYADSNSSTYAFDVSRSGAVSYSAVTWPSAGPFPVDEGFFSSYHPWSITLNPSRYDWDPTGHQVTLRRVSDGRTWTFTSADTDKTGEYFNFEQSGFGVANCFIFRPNPAEIQYAPGDAFDVTLSGGLYSEGTRTPTTVSYRTRFISLTAANIPPTISPIAPMTVGEGSLVSFTPSASDAEGTPLAYSLTGAPAGASIDAETGLFRWTPGESTGGTTVNFRIAVSDGKASASTSVSISVTETNSAPIAVADTHSAIMGEAYTAGAPGVLSNDTDSDLPKDSLSVQLVSDVGFGELSLASDGGFSYTPSPGFYGVDSFRYRVFDGEAYSDAATVSISVRRLPSITLRSPSGTPSFGGSVRLEAVVVGDSADPVVAGTVHFDRWTGSAWVEVGSGATSADGVVSITQSGLRVVQTYRARWAGNTQYAVATSANLKVLPRARLTRTTSWTTLTAARTYYARGYIETRHGASDRAVVIRAYKKGADGSYRYVKSFNGTYAYYSSVKTAYRVRLSLSSRGLWKLVPYHYADSKHAETYGSADYVQVR